MVRVKLVLLLDNLCKNSNTFIPNLGWGSLNHKRHKRVRVCKNGQRESEFGDKRIGINKIRSTCRNLPVGGQNIQKGQIQNKAIRTDNFGIEQIEHKS